MHQTTAGKKKAAGDKYRVPAHFAAPINARRPFH